MKRPTLDREEPIRSWASTANPNPQNTAAGVPHAGRAASVGSQDPVVRGVVAGGQVVDEWIRQAQQAARLLGGSGSSAGWADASGQIFRTASDAMAAWWSLMGVTPPNGGAGFGGQRPSAARHESAWAASTPGFDEREQPDPPPPAERAAHASSGTRVRLEIASRRPVDVTVNVHRNGTSQFRVLDLRAESGDAPRIQGTTLDARDADGVHLRLTVPDDQPSGTYHAVVLDPVLDAAVGTVTLKIPE